jgi:hypothetical protein
MVKNNRTSIIINPDIRDGLKHIARKDQSYNELLAELIKLHTEHNVKMIKCESNLAPRDQSQDQIASSARVVDGGP